MTESVESSPLTSATTGRLPRPSQASRWRWASSRRALVGGGILAVSLGLGGAAAGATTTSNSAPMGGQHGKPPAGTGRPTTGGKITALSGDTITITTQGSTSQTVTFTSSTTFRTMSGTSSSSALKVGDFVGVQGTKNSNGSVTATSIMISTKALGPMGKGGGHMPGGGPPQGNGTPAG